MINDNWSILIIIIKVARICKPSVYAILLWCKDAPGLVYGYLHSGGIGFSQVFYTRLGWVYVLNETRNAVDFCWIALCHWITAINKIHNAPFCMFTE